MIFQSLKSIVLRFSASLYLALAVCFAFAGAAHADLSIDITKSEFDPIRIAVPKFTSDDAAVASIADAMADVISANLERSGLFDVLDPASFTSAQRDISYQPTFADWRVIKAQGLVVGRVIRKPNSSLTVEYRLWDIYGEAQLEGLRLGTASDNWRRIAHQISDSIYKRLTGEAGYFDSRIVFIDESGPKVNRTKRLKIMDQDGANVKSLLAGSAMALTPRFERSAQKIAYLSYESGRPEVYLMDIETNGREKLGAFEGMTTSPRFSPDGNKLLLTQIRRGNSEIFEFDLIHRTSKQLTNAPGIDTSPSYNPKGNKIVFNSDRGGKPQIYIMGADGRKPKRISFGKGRYTAPVWSPRGDKIAFTKSHAGRFHIGVMNIDGSGEKLLTDSYLDEGPTWAPNGRVILFTREGRGQNGRSQIWSVDLTGRNMRKVPTPSGASDPAWSPLLPTQRRGR